MTAIVMNTLNAAVTEYDWAFQSLTPVHAGDATGLYVLGGPTDAGQPIPARAVAPVSNLGSSLKKALGDAYLSLQGPRDSAGQLLVRTVSYDEDDTEVIEEWAYDLPVRSAGVSRATPGKGIRANKLALGYANLDGADFRLDRIEADVLESKAKRRIV